MKILKQGSLRFWGDWFGRPLDNCHRAVKVDYDKYEDILIIYFDNEEICTVFNPIDIVNTENDFYILKATKIIWEWYYYGKEHIPQNLCKRTYSQTINNDILIEYVGEKISSKIINAQNNYALELC